MALKSAQPEGDKVDIEEALDYVDKALDRVKVLYEQFFLGMQKQPPAQIHTDVERRLRELQQLQIRNTGLRYRFATLQQKFGSYNSYWRRTLRQIENGTYIRNLAKISRQAAMTGEEIPDEILAAMPKRMREQVKRDRDQALAVKRRREGDASEDVDIDLDDVMGEVPAPARRPTTVGGAHVLGKDDGDFDIEAFFASVTDESAEPAAPPEPPRTMPIARVAAAASVPRAKPVEHEPTSPVQIDESDEPTQPVQMPHLPATQAMPFPGALRTPPSGVTALSGAKRPGVVATPVVPPKTQAVPVVPMPRPPSQPGTPPPRTPPPIPRAASQPPAVPTLDDIIATPPAAARPVVPAPAQRGSAPAIPPPPQRTQAVPVVPMPARPSGPAPSQASKPNPVAPGSSAARQPIPVQSMQGPFPRTPATKPAPPAVKPETPPARPPPGMNDADVNALYAKYVKAKEMVGEEAGPGAYSKLMKTINTQAPKIMEQYKAKGVEFSIVVKDNQVIIKAKPKT